MYVPIWLLIANIIILIFLIVKLATLTKKVEELEDIIRRLEEPSSGASNKTDDSNWGDSEGNT